MFIGLGKTTVYDFGWGGCGVKGRSSWVRWCLLRIELTSNGETIHKCAIEIGLINESKFKKAFRVLTRK